MRRAGPFGDPVTGTNPFVCIRRGDAVDTRVHDHTLAHVNIMMEISSCSMLCFVEKLMSIGQVHLTSDLRNIFTILEYKKTHGILFSTPKIYQYNLHAFKIYHNAHFT